MMDEFDYDFDSDALLCETESQYHFVKIGHRIEIDPKGKKLFSSNGAKPFDWCEKKFGGSDEAHWRYYGDGLYAFTDLTIAVEFKLLWG